MESLKGLYWRRSEDYDPATPPDRGTDLVVLDFAVEGKHLIIDGVVTSVYRNSIMSRVAAVPRFADK